MQMNVVKLGTKLESACELEKSELAGGMGTHVRIILMHVVVILLLLASFTLSYHYVISSQEYQLLTQTI